jgi:uncharacterized protein (TIGR00730 family)
MISKVCVFAASSPATQDIYLEAAREMATILANHHIEMNYGAGSVGIMGVMADTILSKKGRVTGIIPTFMHNMGWTHPHLEEVIFVETLAERKARMIDHVDAVIAMPGGIGTLEELLEVITLKQLGQFLKPIIIVNTNDFYAPLLNHLQMMIDQQFMRPLHGKIWQVASSPDEVIDLIRSEPDWDPSAIKYAATEANTGRIRTSGQ